MKLWDRVKTMRKRYTPYKISLAWVKDTIEVIEGDNKVRLTVNDSARKLQERLVYAQKALNALANSKSTEPSEWETVSRIFASAIWGEEQAEALAGLYGNDGQAVIAVCVRYFGERLKDKMTQAQIKAGV